MPARSRTASEIAGGIQFDHVRATFFHQADGSAPRFQCPPQRTERKVAATSARDTPRRTALQTTSISIII
jgi:hypothetical protein